MSNKSICEVLLTSSIPQLPDIQIFGLVNAVVVTFSCIYLLSVLSAQYRMQHDDQFLPLLQLLNPRRPRHRAQPGRNVLPRYHTFIASATLGGLVQSFAYITPSQRAIRLGMVSLASISSLLSDLLLVVQLLRPVRCSEGPTVLIAGLRRRPPASLLKRTHRSKLARLRVFHL